ncbi:MAG: hypothetical protein AAFX41_01305 [Bacteroidota bacterium]
MPDSATLIIARNAAYGASLSAALEEAGHPAVLLNTGFSLPTSESVTARITAKHLPQRAGDTRDITSIILDVHACCGAHQKLQDTPGLRFFTELRQQGYTLPVILLTWFEPGDLRLQHLGRCLYLAVRYRKGKQGHERGSFAFSRYPVQPADVIATLQHLRPMSETEWKEITPRQQKLRAVHPPRS